MMDFKIKKLADQYLSFILLLTLAACGQSGDKKVESSLEASELDSQLATLNLPDGFEIAVYAEGVTNARSMTMSPEGTLFVGTRDAGNVYAIQDSDNDFKADKIYVLDTGLRAPNGVAFKDGDLYVAAIGTLFKYPSIENNLNNTPSPETVYDDYPKDYHHGWKYIAFGPDDKLYVPVGAPCNNCESNNEVYASITQMDADGSNRVVYAHGVRNTVGFTWHPETKEMWFTDNGRDLMGDDTPPCELNRVSSLGQHFGYPYCHGGTISDPEFGDKFPCSDFVQPAMNLGAHVAPLGIKFYTGEMFPDQYRGQVFFAEHGSWNRSSKVGYRISMVTIDNNEAVAYDTFIDGWLDEEAQEAWGRPVDVLVLGDGSMLISDDKAGVIYRVSYKA